MAEKHIVAMGGGGFSMEDTPLLDDFVLGLTGVARPRVCFIGTASGDSDNYLRRYYDAFRDGRAERSHLPLFMRRGEDIGAFLLSQHVIYVGGGNTVNMLAIWREHGVDDALRAAWAAGVILCGVSAGSVCWFEHGVTDSYGPGLAPMKGLGFLAGSHCPHYDGEANRRPRYRELVDDGTLPPGVAADDSAALHYIGDELAEVVTSRPGAGAYRVKVGAETPLETRFLGA